MFVYRISVLFCMPPPLYTLIHLFNVAISERDDDYMYGDSGNDSDGAEL